jgi:hypothetical protein
VLILLDCCESGGSLHSNSSLHYPTSTNSGTTELIAASPFDTLAPGPGELSFTRALITELTILAERRERFSVAELHRRVLANIIQKRMGWRGCVGKQWQWPSVSPIYVRLVGGTELPSIKLVPLRVCRSEREEGVLEGKEIVGIERRDSSLGVWGSIYDEKILVKEKRGVLGWVGRWVKTSLFKAPQLGIGKGDNVL